ESHEGILILTGEKLGVGKDFARELGLPDAILEVNVTPNRPDALGHLGVAREVAALFGVKLDYRPDIPVAEIGDDNAGLVKVEDPAGCPRYAAFVLEGIKVGASPLRVRLRLESLGVRAISNVVDATNLVMLETGQPLHAFDLGRLTDGKIVVRRARSGEKLK